MSGSGFSWLIRLVGAAGLFMAVPAAGQAGSKLIPPRLPSVGIGTATLDPGAQMSLVLNYDDGFLQPRPSFVSGSLFYPVGSFLASAQLLGGSTCVVRRNPVTMLEIGRIDYSYNGTAGNPLPSASLCSITFTARTTQPTAAAQALDLTATCDDGLPGKRGDAKVSVACNAFDGALTVNQASISSSPAIGSAIQIITTTTTPRIRELAFSNTGTYLSNIALSGLAPPLSLAPASLGLAAQASLPVRITCAATQAGMFNSTLLASITNDPNRTQASYAVSCDSKVISQTPLAITWNANEHSRAPAINADGNRIVFQSRASSLIESDGDTDEDIFAFDASSGLMTKLSLDNAGNPITSDTIEPTISAQGDLVAFVAADAGVVAVQGETKAASLARQKAGGASVYMRNVLRNTLQRIGGVQPAGINVQPVLAPSGDALVFVAPASPMDGVPGQLNIYRRELRRIGGNGDRELGELKCVSCKFDDPSGRKGGIDASGPSANPVISADGSVVAWESTSALPGQNDPCVTSGGAQVLLRNLITGVMQSVSQATNSSQCGISGQGSRKPSMDYSGRKVVFESDVALEQGTPGDGRRHAYLVDLDGGQTTRLTETVSNDQQGLPGDGDSMAPVISGDGTTVAFVSEADNLDQAGGTTGTGVTQIYVAELDGRRIARMRRASRPSPQALGDSSSQNVALNYSGRRLAYDSNSENLAPEAASSPGIQWYDVFVQDNPFNPDRLFRSGFE